MTSTNTRPSTFAAPAQARPVPFLRLATTELRKSVDTPSGVGVLVASLGLGVLVLLFLVFTGPEMPGFASALDTVALPVSTLLAVLGVLTMTSEWTQRTAMVTFVQVPQRGRVLAAKILAVLVLTVAAVLVTVALTAAAIALTGAGWDDSGRAVGGAVMSTASLVLLGLAFGALLQQTSLALVVYFVLPTLFAFVAPSALGQDARWLDFFAASRTLASGDLDGAAGPMFVALTVWVGLPLLLGITCSIRRDAS